MRKEEISMLVAVDRKRQLKGIITADAALRARNEKLSLQEVLDEQMPTIDKDMLVTDIFNVLYDAKTPLAVVENGKVLGVVIRGSVIEALAETQQGEEVVNG